MLAVNTSSNLAAHRRWLALIWFDLQLCKRGFDTMLGSCGHRRRVSCNRRVFAPRTASKISSSDVGNSRFLGHRIAICRTLVIKCNEVVLVRILARDCLYLCQIELILLRPSLATRTSTSTLATGKLSLSTSTSNCNCRGRKSTRYSYGGLAASTSTCTSAAHSP